VLVAEDDTEMRQLVAEALREEGYEVYEAADGGRLLFEVTSRDGHSRGDLDLVITDIRMPIGSGLRVIEALRNARWKVPVIIMTAFSDEATLADAEAVGAVLFDKPFAMDDLRAAARQLLSSVA
jgi:DNA-binding response OmpR family regulator